MGGHPPHGRTTKHLVFCSGIITVASVYTRPAGIKTKQDTLGDFIRLALPHRLSAALSHSPLFLSVKELVQTCRGRFFFAFFLLARSFLARSHWSAVQGDSYCDCGAQLNLKLLI